MAEPNQGCTTQLTMWIGMLFLGFFAIFGVASSSVVQPLSSVTAVAVIPLWTPTPIGMGATSTPLPVEVGLLELVDMSNITTGEAQDLVGTRIGTTGLPDVSRFSFETIIDNRHIESAVPMLDTVTGTWMIEITFTSEGQAIISAFTDAHMGDVLAIVLNGEVLSTPIIQARVEDRAVVQGSFTEDEARTLAAQLSATPSE